MESDLKGSFTEIVTLQGQWGLLQIPSALTSISSRRRCDNCSMWNLPRHNHLFGRAGKSLNLWYGVRVARIAFPGEQDTSYICHYIWHKDDLAWSVVGGGDAESKHSKEGMITDDQVTGWTPRHIVDGHQATLWMDTVHWTVDTTRSTLWWWHHPFCSFYWSHLHFCNLSTEYVWSTIQYKSH